ncbi:MULTISPECIES: ABC transporter permease [Niastella]|uniref:ABC transporter permease n=1 Tax=Niastella soli TaxID=2821487 RepID=A0ABS3YNV4_9BACT|nr:ABC transporter permease [Niastella soli]MBO9199568.1 ABC transporter permease [Niastella soli]
MIKNYFKTAIRNLFKNGLFSFISISGLALGMAGAGLLLLNIQYKYSIDQFHEKKDRVFKVYGKTMAGGGVQTGDVNSAPLGPALLKEYPLIKQMTRVVPTGKMFDYNDKKIQVDGCYADAAFLDMFSFPLITGNKRTALKDPQSIVITESLAKKIFGTENPVNKNLRLDSTQNFTVTGVLKDIPANSSFQFEYLLPWVENNAKWDNNFAKTYVELKNPDDVKTVNKQIANIISEHSKNEEGKQVFLHAVSKMNLQRHFDANGNPETDGELIFLYLLAAVMLLIGCINFMNLTTARSEKRAKEVGVRKVMGAARKSLVIQFITESTLLAIFSGCIAICMVQLIWPSFSRLAKVPVNIPWESPAFWLSASTFIFLTGLLAGSYPAFYLSSFMPVKVLKGVFNNKTVLITPRRILVVSQFVIAIFLINFTIIFRKQVNYTENRDPGFVKEELVYHPLTRDLKRQYEVVKQELMNTGMVAAICKSNTPVTRPAGWLNGLEWAGGEKSKNTYFSLITSPGNFVKTNGLALTAGRDLDYETYHTDTASVVINESAAQVLGFANPIGQLIKDGNVNWTIVGVVKDFYQGSPNEIARPAMIRFEKRAGILNIRLKAGFTTLQNITTIEEILKKYNPGYITELQFAETDVANSFKQRKNVLMLINSFAIIAIFIACMGLLGLTTYMGELRKREIGIRKVLGASVTRVTTLLTKDFIWLVVIAVLIASPLALLFINYFLQHFSYRTEASWWIVPLSGVIAIFIAALTISFNAIRTAMANPVNSLRSE